MPEAAKPATLFEKIWRRHVVVDRPDGYTLLYVDRHLIHDGSYFAFLRLKNRGLKLRRPDLSFGTPDHYMPTDTRSKDDVKDPDSHRMVTSLAVNGAETGVTVFDIGDRRNGIVHVVGPEQGITLPGITLVCGDSHTSTHGALGCLAFGIGSSEVTHVMATQIALAEEAEDDAHHHRRRARLRRHRQGRDPCHHRQDRRRRRHRLCAGVCRQRHPAAVDGGPADALQHVDRGAAAAPAWWRPTTRPSPISPGKPYAPKGADWDKALAQWKALPSDDGATLRSRGDADRARTSRRWSPTAPAPRTPRR